LDGLRVMTGVERRINGLLVVFLEFSKTVEG